MRVFIGEMPRLLRDILSDLVRVQTDMEVIGRGGDAELADALQRGVDVLILGEAALNRSAAARLLATHPDLTIVTIGGEGRSANLFEIRQVTLIDPSPQMLIQAVRMTQRGPHQATITDGDR